MNVTAVVQETVKFAVATVTSKVVGDFVSKHTDTNEIVIKVGSFAAGAMVADGLKPRTDAIVVKTIAKINAKRSKKTSD